MTLQDVLDAVKSGEVSQVELASRTGLSPSAVSQICSETIKSPKYANAMALIVALQEYREAADKKSSENAEGIQKKSRTPASPAGLP